MTQQFKAMKIRIKDEQHSRLVQETLFEMGCAWRYDVKEVQYTDSGVLWVDDGLISESDMSRFNDFPNEEVELVTTHSFKLVDQEAKRKAAEKEALQNNVAEMQKQLDEMKQRLGVLG